MAFFSSRKDMSSFSVIGWGVGGALSATIGYYFGSKAVVSHFDPVMDMIPSVPFVVGFAFFSGISAYLGWHFRGLMMLNADGGEFVVYNG